MQPFIRVHQLRQSFGTQEVLKGVSFDVGKGELMALIGGSGAGKSVILKHLDGLMDPLDGYVEIDGRRISGARKNQKANPQQHRIHVPAGSLIRFPERGRKRSLPPAGGGDQG